MADLKTGCQQTCPWQNANIPAVLTVRGNIGDADLPHRLNAISKWLQQMAQKGEQEVKVSRVQPWNSVRVTFNIPRSAAQRLQQLAETRNQQLRDLGILAVQVEGHQEVVLNTPPPINMAGPPMAPGLPSTAAPPFQQSPQGLPRPAWASPQGGQVVPGEALLPGQFSPVGNIRPPAVSQVPAFSFTAQQMGNQNRMPMPGPGGFVRPPQDQLPFRPEQVPSNTVGPPEQGGFPPTPQNFPRGFPPGFPPDGSAGFPGNQGPPGPMQNQILPSLQVRGTTRLPVHHLLHNAGLAQSPSGGDPNMQGRDVTQSSPLLVNLLQNDISGTANISLAISRTTQSLMQQGGMQGNLQQQLAMLQQSGLLNQGNMSSPGALQSMLQQAGMLQQQEQQQQQQQPPPKKPAKRRDRSRARQRNKSNQQADAVALHNVPPLPSPQSALSGSPALSGGSPALSASPNLSASPSMAGAGGMASPNTQQHFPSAPSPSIQQGFPSTSSPSMQQGFPRNSSPAVQNNFPTTSSPAVPPNFPSTSSPAVPPNFPATSSPIQRGFPNTASPAMQLSTSMASMPPGFPATSASGMPPGFPPSSGAQAQFPPPSSLAMQQPGMPGMTAPGDMPPQHPNFPNAPSPSYQQAMASSAASPMNSPFSNTPSPNMQQNFPRTSPSQPQPPLPQNFQGTFPNRPPQPGMQPFSNPTQMFPNLPPNAQSPFPNMNQRFPNPNTSQPSFPISSSPSPQQQFPTMQQQQRFPPASSPNFQPQFPPTSTPNASMAAFISQMQNSAAKAMAAMPNSNVPPHMLNMRDGGRGMNEGPSPLASLSNQVGQVPQPPMPPGMGQQRSPGGNKPPTMPPGGLKDVPFDPPTSAHSFLQGQAEFQSAFLRYVQSQQRQPPPRGGRRASPGAAASPGLAGLRPRGVPTPPRMPAPQPGTSSPHLGAPGVPGSQSPQQATMELPPRAGPPLPGLIGPNNGTPKVPEKPPETPPSNTTNLLREGTPQAMGHPSLGPAQGPNGVVRPPPVTTAPPSGAGAPPPGGPAVFPRMAAPPHNTSSDGTKTTGISPDASQPNQSLPDPASLNQSQPDQTGKFGPSGDSTAIPTSQPPADTTPTQLQVQPAVPGGAAVKMTTEPDNKKASSPPVQQSASLDSEVDRFLLKLPAQTVPTLRLYGPTEVATEKAGTADAQEHVSTPPTVQGNDKTTGTTSQVEQQPSTGQQKPEGEGASMGEGVSKGGAKEVPMETDPTNDSSSDMAGKDASKGGGGEEGETVAMETVGMTTQVVATPNNQKESTTVSSAETPSSTDTAVPTAVSPQTKTVKKAEDVQLKPTAAETSSEGPPAGEAGTAGVAEQAGKASETAAVTQQVPTGGSDSNTNSTPGQLPADVPTETEEKGKEEKTPEVSSATQEQTAKKRELPKDQDEKDPTPQKQSKS